MDREELIKKITEKKEFSSLPKKDVEIAFNKFYKEDAPDYQNVKLTRNFLRKIYSSFTSRKLLSPKEKDTAWVLSKHKSTKERIPFYEKIYPEFLKGFEKKKISVIDLGCGVNGFSYEFLKKINPNTKYVGVEAIGQLVELNNLYFKEKNFNGKVYHFSLFDEEKVSDLIKNQKSPKIVFLLKVIDSLEVVKRDYSKELLLKIVPISERVVLSFPTKSLGNRKKFKVQRGWILKFIEENFNLENDFEFGGERYLVFSKNKE